MRFLLPSVSLAVLALAACGSDDPITGASNGSAEVGEKGGRDAAVRDAGGGQGRPTTTRDGAVTQIPRDNDDTCTNLQCQQMSCAGGGSTTISGVVYDPAGKNPLYNVAVYVPNEEVEPLKSGATCDSCGNLYTGKPVASALTDAAGKFTLENAPVGSDIPLVVQVGKWRRQFKIATVKGCQDNPQADKSLRLPKNRQEGDIPNIAVSTGGADTLECLLRRVGLDASEFVPGASDQGRVHIYGGGGENAIGGIFGIDISTSPNTSPPGPASSAQLWNDKKNLSQYDIVLLSCEGSETANMNQQAMHDYADSGGRVFASHFHYAWFSSGPYASENLATWRTGSQDIDDIQSDIVTTLPDGKPFVKGQALSDWLGNVGALQNGKLPIQDARHNADIGPANMSSQAWIVADKDSEAPGAAQYFSFNTPTVASTTADTATGTCGRVVFSDLHVGAASGDRGGVVPDSCSTNDLSPQEKALEFMLFDLSSCIVPDTAPPEPPVIVPI